MTPELLLELVSVLVPLVLSLTVHEYAHAAMAKRLGDDTAERQGRMTLDPTSHIDPIGSLALPAFLVLAQTGFYFGWAKPVPYNPLRFRRTMRMRHGVVLVAAAGPISNLLLAILCALALRFVGQDPMWVTLLQNCVLLNVLLFFFNLVPVPPLDGSKVVQGLLPDQWQGLGRFFEDKPYIAPMAFLMVFMFAGRIIGPPMMAVTSLILSIFAGY